jgi:hypothetical protein
LLKEQRKTIEESKDVDLIMNDVLRLMDTIHTPLYSMIKLCWELKDLKATPEKLDELYFKENSTVFETQCKAIKECLESFETLKYP